MLLGPSLEQESDPEHLAPGTPDGSNTHRWERKHTCALAFPHTNAHKHISGSIYSETWSKTPSKSCFGSQNTGSPLSPALPWGSWTILSCHPPHLRHPGDETVITHILRLHVTYQTLWIWLVECHQILAPWKKGLFPASRRVAPLTNVPKDPVITVKCYGLILHHLHSFCFVYFL